MSAAANAPDPPTQPSRSARLLGLVRRLIDYGKELAATIRERIVADPISGRCGFGTVDVGLILARIARGLHRANALEARLLSKATVWTRRPDVLRPQAARASPGRQPRRLTAKRTNLSPASPPPIRSPPRSAASRSAPSSPTSAATSASRRDIRCGENCSS